MQMEEGAILSGKVTGLTAFGAFVEFEDGTTGMVHISEVSNTYVKDIKDHLTLNQEVKVKVLTIGKDGKISLSIKKLLEPEQKPRAEKPERRRPNPQVWQGAKSNNPPAGEKQSFEDMMNRFKQESDEKITDLKRSSESKRGSGGYSRRGR